MNTRFALVGDDFRFGAERRGDIVLLRRHAEAQGCDVEQIDTVLHARQRVSSSAVRAALAAGDLAHARELLGATVSMCGRVQHGRKLGRTLGFPTLNLRVAHQAPALQGIFAVRVRGLDTRALPGVASLGLRPTVDDSGRWLLEVHVFDFDREVYGRLVTVEFCYKLRDEQRYTELDALRRAIAEDAAQARRLLGVTAD